VKYGDGSIIKATDDKLYLINQGFKIEIPDQKTYESLGLNVSDHTFTIRAKGRADDGVFPIIQLRIDGQVIKEWFVSGEYKDYTTTVPLSEGEHKIDIAYPNDQDIETYIYTWQEIKKSWWGMKQTITTHNESRDKVIADRELTVDYIKINNETIEPGDKRVKYDKGSSNNIGSLLDGNDLIAGQELMNDSGALRLSYDFRTAIGVTAEEIKDTQDGGKLPAVQHENGTILKDESGKLWLSVMGQRRLIPDEITFDVLGFAKEKIKNISSTELSEIPETEAIPEIKYKNGTILRGPDNKYYLMNMGIRREVVDSKLLEDFAMNYVTSQAKEVTAVDNFPTDGRYIVGSLKWESRVGPAGPLFQEIKEKGYICRNWRFEGYDY
ncbi:MAG: carbohydrate-binding domain-containing protein, partial [Candidatus Desantisbacteria bacterium]